MQAMALLKIAQLVANIIPEALMLSWLSCFLCIFVKSIKKLKTLNLELNVRAIMDNTMNLFSSDFPLNVVFNVIVQPQCTFL